MLRKKLREIRGIDECDHVWLGQQKSLSGVRWLTVCLKCGKIKKD